MGVDIDLALLSHRFNKALDYIHKLFVDWNEGWSRGDGCRWIMLNYGCSAQDVRGTRLHITPLVHIFMPASTLFPT